MNKGNKYEDIINLPRPVSKRPHMSRYDRAAQFSAFAALTGHDAAIKETARLTTEKIILDENQNTIISRKLKIIQDNISGRPKLCFIYFKPDERKSGGAYLTIWGNVKKVNLCTRLIILEDETIIPIDDIYDITGDMFSPLDDYSFI